MTWISIAAFILGLSMAQNAVAQNVYRWTDDDGRVHYTPALPPEAGNRPYDILSQSGVLIERVTDPSKRNQPQKKKKSKYAEPEPLYTESQRREIADRLLLLKYRNEQEVLDAMQLEIDHLQYDERILSASLNSVEKTLVSQIQLAANRQRSGQVVKPEQEKTILGLQRRLERTRQEHEQLAVREEAIRDDFNEDLERYRSLVETTEQDG